MDPTNVARSFFKSPLFTHIMTAVGAVVATVATQKVWASLSKPGAVAAPAAPKLVTFDVAKFAALTPDQQTLAVNQAMAAQAAQAAQVS